MPSMSGSGTVIWGILGDGHGSSRKSEMEGVGRLVPGLIVSLAGSGDVVKTMLEWAETVDASGPAVGTGANTGKGAEMTSGAGTLS